MATLTITVPNGVANRVLTAICSLHGYQATIDDGTGNMIPNPQTQQEFVRQYIITVIKNQVVSYEGQQAAIANATAVTNATNQILIT